MDVSPCTLAGYFCFYVTLYGTGWSEGLTESTFALNFYELQKKIFWKIDILIFWYFQKLNVLSYSYKLFVLRVNNKWFLQPGCLMLNRDRCTAYRSDAITNLHILLITCINVVANSVAELHVLVLQFSDQTTLNYDNSLNWVCLTDIFSYLWWKTS